MRSGQEARLQKIDNKDLRAILKAQKERQKWTLEAVSEAANNGCTFDVWFNRYKGVIAKDGSKLDEVGGHPSSSRSWMQQLTPVLPTTSKRAPKVCFDDTVKMLKALYG
ncbi:unnamed protein product [Toxocara canis]|uniref:Transposase n=1 Tax=Toxocara canis TaxID=6265 RepID=A0A183VCU5_TOXCA|nr:unnamed protein product [Toxocara canis]